MGARGLTLPQSEALRGHIAMLSFSALVAGSFSLGAMMANEIDPAALTALRFIIAAAFLGAIAGTSGRLRRTTYRAPWRFIVLGGIYASYFVLMFEALKTATAVSTAAVFTMTPVMAAGFGYLLLGQQPTWRIAGALAIGAAGALWVIFRADLAALLAFEIGRGEAIFFVGCAAHALYTPLARKLNRGEPADLFTIGTLTGGGVLLTLWGAEALRTTDWAALPPIVWVALLYVAIPASAVTFVLVQYATLRLPSSKVMAYTYLTPAWVILWEIALGHGTPPMRVWIGLGLTLAALALLLREEP